MSPTDTSNKNECATGANWITGTKEDQSAYRSKLGGIIAALTIIDAIIRYKDILTGSVTISLDNDSAIDECSYDSVISTNNKSFDYIQVIKTWIEDLPIKVTFRYVSGHQLKHRSYNDLDWWEKRNEDMDKEAKSFLRFCTLPYASRSHTNPVLYKEKWSISVDGTKIIHPDRKNLYLKIYGRRTLEYWNGKDSTPVDPNRIDWESSRKAMQKETKGKRRIDVKFLCEQCGLNKVLYNRQQRDNHRCPLCNGERETRDHLLTCPHTESTKRWATKQKKLSEKLKKLQTHAKLSKSILGNLKRLRFRKPMRTATAFTNEVFGEGISLTNH